MSRKNTLKRIIARKASGKGKTSKNLKTKAYILPATKEINY